LLLHQQLHHESSRQPPADNLHIRNNHCRFFVLSTIDLSSTSATSNNQHQPPVLPPPATSCTTSRITSHDTPTPCKTPPTIKAATVCKTGIRCACIGQINEHGCWAEPTTMWLGALTRFSPTHMSGLGPAYKNAC
jgi:hypothetical protein